MPTGRDAAASVVARTRADNTGLTRGMQEADRIVRQGAQQMQRTASTSGGNIGDALAGALSGRLGTALSFAGVAVDVAKAAKAAYELTAELYAAGAAAERLNTGFQSMVGGGGRAAAMLDGLRDASRGTISDMDLVASANRAMMLQVTDDADTMARLLEVAIARGRNLGIGAQQAFSDIVTGIGRMSPMILDNLGILTGGQQGMEAYAESIGKTSDQLSDFEKRQYLVNKVLEDQTPLTNDAAEGLERLAAAQANLREEIALRTAEGLPDVAGARADVIQGIADQMRRHREAADAMTAYKDQLIEMANAGLIADEQLGMMTSTWVRLSQEVDRGRINVEQAKLAMLGAFPELRGALEEFAKAQEEATIQTELASGAALRKELADMRAARAARDRADAENQLTSALIGQASAMYRPLQDPRIARAVGAGRDPTRKILDPDREWLAEPEKALPGIGGGGISDAQRLAEQRAREFESLVQSVLQPTQVTGADVSATEHGAYVDKWDEYIRRLRADQSIPYYQRMETERQFYSGQMLDQVNWDAVIQDIARKQQEEAGRQNLLNEAMRRAQEAGLAANYADVAASLGIRDDTVTGAEAAQAFEEGAKSVDVAAGVVEQFVEGVRAQRQAMVDAGAESMRAFLEGSDQAITPDAGKKFARRIVPFIYDEFKAQGML